MLSFLGLETQTRHDVSYLEVILLWGPNSQGEDSNTSRLVRAGALEVPKLVGLPLWNLNTPSMHSRA